MSKNCLWIYMYNRAPWRKELLLELINLGFTCESSVICSCCFVNCPLHC